MFEGSEKKLEVVARRAHFLRWPESAWHELVAVARGQILSKIQGPDCIAYLLSESSLFVWDDRVLMITCGRTTLVEAASHLAARLKDYGIDLLTYERKNEFYPHQQSTDFRSDVAILENHVQGQAYRFGPPDDHHLFLYHAECNFLPEDVDCTLEILMYDLHPEVADLFCADRPLGDIRARLNFGGYFEGFEIDDHLFEPWGYSLNALRGPEYYTIHVTPEKSGSYVSFETNSRLGAKLAPTVNAVVSRFCPRAFDLIYFHTEKELQVIELEEFKARHHVRQALSCGYQVGFSTYNRPCKKVVPAVPLNGLS